MINIVVLTLTHMYPYPITDGGKIVTYNTIKYLNRNGVRNIIITFNNKCIKSKLDNISEVHVLKKNTENNLYGAVKNLFSTLPYNIYKYKDRRVKILIDYIIKKNKIDVIYIDHLHMAIYAEYIKIKYPNIRIILREHNVETIIMERFYKNQKNLFIKLYSFIQYIKLRNYEKKILNYFNLILTLTEDDRNRLLDMSSQKNVKTIPAGVDIDKYYPNNSIEEDNTIVFLGSMNWLPNEDGIYWFVRTVFCKVLEKNNKAKLYIVGKNPTQKVKDLSRDNIIVTGFVEDDREYIAKASIFIVPLRIGGGMRIKILNAMSMEKCIISTSIGAEGIDSVNEKEIIIEDDSQLFADKIIEYMDKKLDRDIMGKKAREKIIDRYSWKAIVNKIYLELK